jgi:hypothetical protein
VIRTPEDADRLFGKGFGLGEWMRKNAGEARKLIHVCYPVAPANPQPAPSQVWASPEGEPRPGWVDVDGTVTFAENHETPRDGRLCLTRGGTMDARDLDGWRCIGVATERGRVMVGDGFRSARGWDVAVVAVASVPGAVIIRWDDGAEPCVAAESIVGWTRIRYAPARVGERYRKLATGRVARVDRFKHGVPRWNWDDEMGDGRVCKMEPKGCFPVAEWERLDPSTASHAVAPVARKDDALLLAVTGAALDSLASTMFGIERNGPKGSAYRGATEAESDESLRARCMAKRGGLGVEERRALYTATRTASATI